MPDSEKVINKVTAIVADMQEEVDEWKDYSDSELRGGLTCDCDWWYKTLQTLKDALALLKAQEPRVMTIGDLYGEDMGYYERKNKELVCPVLIACGGPNEDETVGIVLKDAFEIKADCDLMNITWRIWTAYPTMEQREATPWN